MAAIWARCRGRDGASLNPVSMVVLLLLALLLSACGDAADTPAEQVDSESEAVGTSPPAASGGNTPPDAAPNNSNAAALPPDAAERAPRDPHYYEVINISVGGEGTGGGGDIDQFWKQEFPKLGTNTAYVSPRARYSYYPVPGRIPRTACVPRNADPKTLANNAFYCPEDQIIAWDENFLWSQYERYGDMAPVTILAHEWGHHIQRLAGYPAFSVQAELQADCYAGLYTKNAETRGYLEEGDVQEAMYSLYDAGNPAFDNSLWFAPGEHGSPEERAKAYLTGYQTGDPEQCLAYRQYKRGSVIEVGPYVLALAPGTKYQRLQDGTYQLQNQLGNALIRYVPDLPPQPAVEQIAARTPEWLGEGAQALDVPPEEVEINPTEGTDAVQRYQQTVQARNGSTQSRHGFIFLHVDANGGGYVVDTYAPGPPPAQDEAWEPLIQHLRVLLAGLKRNPNTNG